MENKDKYSQNNKKWYLESINIEAFGKYYGKKLGKFKDGLNIVYGNNEAGKSTFSMFIMGVLTGWANVNKAKKQVNKFNASNNNRSGVLVFANNINDEKVSISRTNNKDLEIVGNPKDIEIPDKETYETMFSLNSDRLWSLGSNEKEITSQFLTAETGTKYAPASALNNVSQNIKNYNSKNANLTNESLVAIDTKIDEFEEIINIEENQKQQFNQKAKELPMLEKQNIENINNLEKTKKYLDKLKNAQTEINFINKKDDENKQKLHEIDNKILNYANSYKNDNFKDVESNKNKTATKVKSNKNKTIITIIVLLVALIMGIVSYMTGFNETVFTIAKIFFIVAIITLVVNFILSIKKAKKPAHKNNEDNTIQQDNIELVKLQTMRDQRFQEQRNFELSKKQIFSELNNISNVEALCYEIEKTKENIKNYNKIIDDIKQKITQVQTQIKSINTDTINFYKQSLSIENQKKQKLLDNYIVDLFTEKILEEAIEDWKTSSQPQVYKDASRFLEIMTNAKWSRIFQENEKFYISNKDRTKNLEADKLSLSTRQQLYLALRIAILIRPESAGKNIPVVCDDILVNFDDQRQVGAIKAICELSKYRQVIMFTCHKNLLEKINKEISNINNIQL